MDMHKNKHLLLQNWENLSFMHWIVNKDILERHIPEGLKLDLYQNNAFVGVIPFMMKNVRPRWGPSISFISNFPEFNIRTYVKSRKTKGVFFLTLDAQSMITRIFASNFYHLPYRYSRGYVTGKGQFYSWKSRRLIGDFGLEGSCEGVSEYSLAKKKSLEEFLFERYYLFVTNRGKILKGYIYHKPWKLRVAKSKIINNNFLKSYSLGIKNVLKPDYCHQSEGVDVKAWPLKELDE
tara:strand:+ start:2578 stop:3285 length:708 start_codon:yes stop_codon:yes gene_type:complete